MERLMRPPGKERPRPVVRGYQLPSGDELTCRCGRKYRKRLGLDGGYCSTTCRNRYGDPTKKPGD